MAAMRKGEEFDMEGLKELKKSLICDDCKRPPRPETKYFQCVDIGCELKRCESCSDHLWKCHGKEMKLNSTLTKFAGLFKFYNCVHLKNGCQEELEAKSLRDHEKICLFRDVRCPKIECKAKFAFNGIMDHYQSTHNNGHLKIKDDVLEFKGRLEDLTKSTFILNSYGKPFFPQFRVNGSGNVLQFWVIGHGDETEMKSFEVSSICNFSYKF